MAYLFTEKFDTLKPQKSPKRFLKSKLLIALGATGSNRPFAGNTERIIERKMLYQNATSMGGGGGGGGGGGTACAAGTTFASAWAARVVVNGGAAPSAATQLAIAQFQCGLITDGLDTQMLMWNAFVSDNLIAAITPQLKVGNDPWTNNGFVLADLTAAGLIGDGAGKYLNTGVTTSNALFWGAASPNNNTGVTAYVETNTDPAGTDVITGSSDGGAALFALELFGGNTRCFMHDVGSLASAANAGFTGYVSVNRTAVNSLSIYEANSGTPHHLLTSSAVNNTGGGANVIQLVVFAYNDNTGVQLFTNHRLGFIGYHFGLSSAQSALYSARIQTLMGALNRAI